ncbi:unnamed protein product [Allacma fusca]|uniref:Uncharacterized protein n=1 Tax=Allacma fusca TaxID=39272 RepID=A0A8J2NU52_9HEXA|nr:unnamed protein product [Allacma fusca]
MTLFISRRHQSPIQMQGDLIIRDPFVNVFSADIGEERILLQPVNNSMGSIHRRSLATVYLAIALTYWMYSYTTLFVGLLGVPPRPRLSGAAKSSCIVTVISGGEER